MKLHREKEKDVHVTCVVSSCQGKVAGIYSDKTTVEGLFGR